jgi:membrane protein YdbS with pleckstrin-like domain
MRSALAVWRAFTYSKRPFIANLVLLVVVLITIIYLLLTINADLLTLMAIVIMGFVFLTVLGISPWFTDHELEDEALLLRQGWYFRARIPLSDIRAIERVPRGPSRTGVYFRLSSPTLYVTTRRKDLAEIVLREKHPFIWALGKKADRIVFDAEELDALVRSIEARLSLSPVQTEGPDP